LSVSYVTQRPAKVTEDHRLGGGHQFVLAHLLGILHPRPGI
jgi:hypothetical protein